MDEIKQIKRDVMEINWEQQKVLSHPLRAKLVVYLYEKPMTPKQAADLLGKNPGTVYYHIQQLVKHNLLEVESVNTDKGIVEKYYRAKANIFRNPDKPSPSDHVESKIMNIYLSEKLLNQLSEEIEELFFKYGELSEKEMKQEEQLPYSIEFTIKKANEEEK